MDRELIKYAPIYRAWYRLAHAKDTAEKRLAFLDGILDYAFTGAEAADPTTLENPHGADYARFDGYLTAKDTLDEILSGIALATKGGLAGRGECKARFGNQNARKWPTATPDGGGSENEISPKMRKRNRAFSETQLETQPCVSQNATENATINISKVKLKLSKSESVIAREGENADSASCVSSDETPISEIPVNSDEAIPQGEDGQPDLRRVLPTRDEMVCYARQIGVPASYLPTFVGEMRSLGWGYVNRSGAFVALNRRNFKAILRSFYNQHERNKANGNDGTGSRQARSTAYDEGLAAAAGV